MFTCMPGEHARQCTLYKFAERCLTSQVLDGALAGDNGLHKEAKHGEHGKTAVLDLLDLELRSGIRVISQAQGVK